MLERRHTACCPNCMISCFQSGTRHLPPVDLSSLPLGDDVGHSSSECVAGQATIDHDEAPERPVAPSLRSQPFPISLPEGELYIV